MRAQSDEFLALVKTSHTSITEVELWRSGSLVDTLPVVGGSVNASLTGAIRRSCEFQIADPTGEYTPRTALDILYPTGTEAVVKRGVLLSSGEYEWCSLGVFRLVSVNTEVGENGALHVCTGYDRSYLLQKPMQMPYSINTGVNIGTAITSLLLAAMPTIQLRPFVSAYTTQYAVFDPQTAPWTVALGLAQSVGADVFFDADGVCTISPFNYQGSNSTWNFEDTTWRLRRSISTDTVPSVVIVEGVNSGNTGAVRGAAFDTDPTSPTYYLGSYGAAVYYVTNDKVGTQGQAQNAAVALLRRMSRAVEEYEFECIPNPALAEGDVITLGREALSMAPLDCVITNIRTPLDMSAQSISVLPATIREVGIS